MTIQAAEKKAAMMARATGVCYYVLGPDPVDGYWACRAYDRVQLWPDHKPLFTAAPNGRTSRP